MVQISLRRPVVFLSTLAALQSTSAYEFLVGVGKDETTGKKGLGFDPSVIYTQPGDGVTFEFRSGVHSVVQSSYETPCIPSTGGFDAGVHTVDDDVDVDAPNLPTVRMPVNVTGPMWFFDRAGGACFKGAVLAINPTENQTAMGFKSNAAQAGAHPASSSSTPISATGADSTATTSATDSPQFNGASSAKPLTFGVAAISLSGMLLSGIFSGHYA